MEISPRQTDDRKVQKRVAVLMEGFHAASAFSVVNHDTMNARLKYLTGLRIPRRIMTDGDRDENG
jgi:hypothetical protein